MDIIVVALLSLALGVALGALWSTSRGRAAHELALQERAALAAGLEAERRSGAEKIALLKDAENKLREAFSALSAEALKQNSESFLQLARTSLGEFQKAATMDLDGRHKSIESLVQPLQGIAHEGRRQAERRRTRTRKLAGAALRTAPLADAVAAGAALGDR